MEAGECFAARDSTRPAPNVPSDRPVALPIPRVRRQEEVEPRQIGCGDGLDVALLLQRPFDVLKGEALDPLDVAHHVEGRREVRAALRDLGATLGRPRERDDFGRGVLCIEVGRDAGLVEPVVAQEVCHPGGAIEADNREPVRQRVDGYVGQRVETRTEQQYARPRINGLEINHLIEEMNAPLESGAADLIREVHGVGDVAAGVVSLSNPYEADRRCGQLPPDAGGAINE